MAEVFNIGDEVVINWAFTEYNNLIGTILERNEWEDEDEEYDEDEDEYITTPRWVVEYKVRFKDPFTPKWSSSVLYETYFEDRYLSYHNTVAKITEPPEDIYNDLI